jgi:anti-anti-sigma regulatory factor
MMNHIDISSVLRQTLACDLYSNLVTRPTGAAVRGQIEVLLSETNERALTVIDFSQVSMIDFSCADEVVAKLLIRYADESRPHDAYFLFRGVSEHHRDAIEAVLERHGLALAIEQEDGVELMGVLTDVERRAWDAVYRLGKVDAADLAAEIETSVGVAQEALDALAQQRLVMCADGEYVAIGRNNG